MAQAGSPTTPWRRASHPPGGNLVLNGQALPPPLQLTVTLNSTGSLTSGGAAVIGGRVTCPRPADVTVTGTLRQQNGSKVTVGSYRALVSCTSSHAWQATVVGETGITGADPPPVWPRSCSSTTSEVSVRAATATIQFALALHPCRGPGPKNAFCSVGGPRSTPAGVFVGPPIGQPRRPYA